MMKKTRVIALEEHYLDPEVRAHFGPNDATRGEEVLKRLLDLTDLRLREMDEAGIDVQVLSHGSPSVQKMDAQTAVGLAHKANDRLHEALAAHPDRFAAFATIPTPAPEAAADELERAVRDLGFKGAMVHGLTNGEFLDKKKFWPIFARAEALGVPIYVHPSQPHPAVVDAYYADYAKEFPWLIRAAWGYTVETATQGIRLILSGVFDEYPRLKIIMGHMGEGLPFYLWRISQALSREGRGSKTFRDDFCEHFYITTSGFFSDPALVCCAMEMGVDRILFSVDYPFVENAPGTQWMNTVPFSAADKAKILSGNAEKLLNL
ncbi:MAG: amidohydrolase [Alphaproteobacteria bacterium]|nr:amidohydrolase [Alphaproteobacteria bacterium]